MRNNTDRNKKIAPVVAAMVVVGFLGAFLLAFLSSTLGIGSVGIGVAGIIAIYALVIVAIIVGVILAMRQRLREIDSGEEEDAKNIDEAAQARRKKDAWQSAVTTTLLRLGMATLLLLLRWYHHMEGVGGSVMLIIALVELGTVVPVWILLKTRLREIEGGEEDAAAQY